jgi:hypothetical protein
MTERLKVEHIKGGQLKPVLKIDARDDVDRDTGRPTWKQLVVDYENDQYRETVTIKATGEILIDKPDRLSEHRGRGSAKRR